MYVRQRDVVVGTALVLYIVFFALSPPAVVRTILSQPIGVAASFGVAIYITLYYSRPIGAILIVALLASMTSVTEHMTDAEKSKLQSDLDSLNKSISNLQGMGLTESNDALRNAIQQRNSIQSQLASTPTAPATPGSSELADLNKTISELQGMGLRPETNDALKNALARRDQLQRGATPPMTTPTAPAASSPAPAMPPSAAPPTSAPARPVMACNIENFAPF